MAFTGAVTKLTLPGYIDNGSREHSTVKTAAIDLANGFLYVSTSSSPVRMRFNVVKIRLSDFTYVTTLAGLNTSWNEAITVIKHPTLNRLYLATTGSIGINDWIGSTFGVSIAPAGMGFFASAAFTGRHTIQLDVTRDRVYSTGISTVNGSTHLTSSNGITLATTEFTSVPTNSFCVIDKTSTYAYVISGVNPNMIYKFDLATQTVVGTTATGFNIYSIFCKDLVNNFAYFGTTNGYILKFDLTTGLQHSATPTTQLPRGDGEYLNYNTYHDKIYTMVSGPGSILRVIEVDATSLTVTDMLDFPEYPGSITQSPITMDQENGFVYVGTPNTTPAVVMKIGITPPPPANVPKGGGPSIKRKPYPFHPSMISSGGGTGFGMQQKIIRP